ncbi:MAG TPA: hypothetical protein VFL93_15645 [Longimicrobiaceae bacterium]|nr:hypothetical protein [Longimicrobiaceae bacterium]
MTYVSNEDLFPVWREPRSFWERTGLSARQRHGLDVALTALVVVLLAGWVYSVAAAIREGRAPQMARRIGVEVNPLSETAPPPAAFLLQTALDRFAQATDYAGESGAVRVIEELPGEGLAHPDSLPPGVRVTYAPVGKPGAAPDTAAAPSSPGVWNVLLQARDAIRAVPDLSVITLVPRSRVRGGILGGYHLGTWPEKGGIYTPPRGFIEVTPQNEDTYVSEHIQLKDFLTKGQAGVWPKYVAMSPRLLDKLELTFQELEREGHPVKNIFAISGFRTPYYNENGGDTSGRAALSRHMYGDAMDVVIDNDHDGYMDDLNGDGKVNVKDARVLAEAAQRVEEEHPDLVGGIGVYAPTGAHHGFVHIDTRGYRARWGAW